MTRLLIYSDRNGIFGAEQIDHRLAIAFQAAGYTVVLAQPRADNALAVERTQLGIRAYALPDENIYDWQHPAPSLTDASAAEACFAAVRPDVILFTDSFPFANLAAKEAAARLGINYLVLVHCVQPSWAVEYRAFLPRLPAVYAAAREVVAVSSDNLQLLRHHFGLPASRGRVIHNGRPEVYFTPPDAAVRQRVRSELGIPEGAVLTLSVGRYERPKGYDLLLEALPLVRRTPQWQRLAFVWVGSGTLEARLRHFVRFVGGNQVQVLGERGDVAALFDAADMLLHPARFEGMPLVVLEAMAKGLPIIASGIGGCIEALGNTGILLPPPGDVKPFANALAAAVCRLCDDAEERRRLGAAAFARAQSHFSEARMTANYLDLLQHTLAQR